MKKIVWTILSAAVLVFVATQASFKRINIGCAFCKQEVVASQLFYRGDKVLGLLTHKPAAPGHVLIIPERHVERFEDLTAEEMAEIQQVIKKVHAAVGNLYGNKGYLLLQKNGKEAGQSVPHIHFHYLPAVKFLAVRFFVSPWLKALSADEMAILREDLSGSISESTSIHANRL